MKAAIDWKAFPKIELHEHLDGSLRIDTILELAKKDGVRLPTAERKELEFLLSPLESDLVTYLKAFAVTTAVMQNAEALKRVAFEMVEDWYADGVVYGEVRFAPELHTQKGLSRSAAVEAVLDGLSEGRRRYPVETGLILCTMRHLEPSLETAVLVNQYRNDGVLAFDIAGAEEGFPPSLHRAAYEYCAKHSLSTTCHAGEVTGPDYIREALEACGSLRIGHGTQLIQEWGASRVPPGTGSLTGLVRDRQIPLELCLSSNVQTRACRSLAEHPFPEFLKAGLAVTLNTDNRLMSATSLSRELQLAQETWNLPAESLRRVEQNALAAAFCSTDVKSRIRAKHFS